ncbi:MAG: glucosamine-6-phosphate isomerase [Candidatus Anoxymicrobium japonicum]|uniref:Glucosamine-6-phosphate isomerase n=1 Tax=Candidatus Anoxymicrobium japonicum TaxID=2013648 RepID=A0A2N3G4Q2_9ACTN|nr:MAG: glucosamine-6-phosphate isomerase [Candidatus Anoxymicrobium japonicum]
MARPDSLIAPGWWDYTTLDREILSDAARLTQQDLASLSRPGFDVVFYDTLEEFYLAEALEYIEAWRQATPDNPAGICGPIGPTAQLPLVAQLVNSLHLELHNAYFWGMDEWMENGRSVQLSHQLSFARKDRELCFDRIEPRLRMPDSQMLFPVGDLDAYSRSFDEVRCVVMQGGQGDVKHWAFNDPFRREGAYLDEPPSVEEYLRLATRVVELHPATVTQNARALTGGNVTAVPARAATVGPVESWKAERVSIWQAGMDDNPFGMRLTALMVSKGIADSSVPMSLLAGHPNVRFSFYRAAFDT